MEKKVKGVVEEILKVLEIDATFELLENEEGYDIILTTEDSGIVIGHHGDTLEALQTVISLSVSKTLGEFKRISLEVGDYKKNREEYIKSLVAETKDKVLSEKKEIFLPDLKPWERRIVHIILQEDKEVTSESIGEGKDRVLVVKPKN